MSIVQFVFCLKRKREIGIGDRAEIIDNQHSSDVVINEKDILRSNKADISSDGQYAKKRNTK